MRLSAAARRLLWRAAAFLWMMFLSAMESITRVEARNCAVATPLSPAATALRTDLMAVRRRERRLELWAFCLTAWRARLRAEAMLAMRKSRCGDLAWTMAPNDEPEFGKALKYKMPSPQAASLPAPPSFGLLR